MPDFTGQSIGRYHILEQIGEGGMAVVYKAYDTHLDRDVAVKFIRMERLAPELAERTLKRFQAEAKIVSQLTHTHIVKVTDYHEYQGVPYLVMEYLPGGSLKQLTGKPMPFAQAARLLAPVARALEYAHNQNPKIIHRDVKPSNILITRDGEPMLTDFGIAKILKDDASQDRLTLTGAGIGVGTPEYMAPEQWVNQPVPQSDIYSLGVVFYELVTGRVPYKADTPAALLIKQTNDALPRPKQFVADLPEGVEKVIFKAMAKKTEDRYQTMGEFAGVLERLGREADETGKIKEGEVENLPPVTQPEPRPETSQEASITQDELGKAITAESLAAPQVKPEKHKVRIINLRRWIIRIGLSLLVITMISLSSWGISTIVHKSQERTSLTQTAVAVVKSSTSPSFLATSTISIEAQTVTLDKKKSPTLSPTITNTLTSVPSLTPFPTPLGGSGRIAYRVSGDRGFSLYIIGADGTSSVALTQDTMPIPAYAWSPDGHKIAYTYKAAIFVENYDGSNKIQLANVAESNVFNNIGWSYNGEKIAINYNYGGGYKAKLGIVGLGNPNQPLILDTIYSGDFAWSPIEDKLAFVSYDGNYDIYTMSSAGSNRVRLTNDINQEYNLIWSPDGQKIAFRAYKHNVDTGKLFYVIDSDGTNRVEVTGTDFDWSPDAREIVYVNNGQIYKTEANGSNQIQLTNDNDNYFQPLWSPDGKKIVYTSNYGYNSQIYIMDANGSNQTNINCGDRNPVWSPDSMMIASISTNNYSLCIMNADGTNQHLTAKMELNSYYYWDLFWAPAFSSQPTSVVTPSLSSIDLSDRPLSTPSP